jgi:predicted O-methyltransferase YrrM
VHVRAAVALAWRTGLSLDLRACDYGPGMQGQFRAGPPRYYHFLGGLAWITSARRIVEVGTHYGGSARALAEGQRAAGLTPNVLTYDVEDRAGDPIVGFDGVERVLADIREPEGQARLAAWAGTEPVDLVYIDALKDAEFIETTIAALAGRTIGLMVFDDIFANANIRTAWNRIRSEHGRRAVTVDEVVLGIRSGGYGQGVVALQQAALDGLSTELLRAAAHRRWGRVAARLTARGAGDDPDIMREAIACCTGEGEVVVVGANDRRARAMAEALAARTDLDRVSVNVIASFLGSGSPHEPHYEAPVRRNEPSLTDFRNALGDAAPFVNLLAGDVPSLRWPGRPIELAVVTWSPDPRQLEFVWRELLPWCIPGGSLIVFDGVHRDAGDPQQLGPLLGHVETLALGPDCLALAPVGPALNDADDDPVTRLSMLGVPISAAGS